MATLVKLEGWLNFPATKTLSDEHNGNNNLMNKPAVLFAVFPEVEANVEAILAAYDMGKVNLDDLLAICNFSRFKPI